MLVLAGCSSLEKQHENRRPNIILIITDDQRWDMLGCEGNSIIQTPNMDRLANEGIRFTHAFVSTPICAASRASIFTGLYERTHNFTFGKPPISENYTDISYPRLLKEAGYRTGFVGKFGVKVETSTDSLFSWKRINGFPYWKTINGEKIYLTDLQGEQAAQFISESANVRNPFACHSVLVHPMPMTVLWNNTFGLRLWIHSTGMIPSLFLPQPIRLSTILFRLSSRVP